MKEPKRSQILRKLIIDLNGAEFSCSTFKFEGAARLLTDFYKAGKLDRVAEQKQCGTKRKVWFYKANSSLKLKEVSDVEKKEVTEKKSNIELIYDLFLTKPSWTSIEVIEQGFHRKSARACLRTLELQKKIHISGHLNLKCRVPVGVYTLGSPPDNKDVEVNSRIKVDSSSVWKDIWPELFTIPNFKELGVKVHSHPY
jgi:hypothetical protein